MTVKPKIARAYVRAAYAAALAATAGIAMVTGSPGIANASAAAPSAIHRGTWRINGIVGPHNQSNAKSITHTTVSACVTFTSGMGTYGWHLKVVDYDGGKNKVLWQSKEQSENTDMKCSPKLKVPGHLPHVYSVESIDCNAFCQTDGNWSMSTN